MQLYRAMMGMSQVVALTNKGSCALSSRFKDRLEQS
jgi:hypothetical protein